MTSDRDELVRMATRIQVRAVRRCGELLKAIAPRETAGPPPRNYTGTGTITRTQAAADAGLSKRQKDTALRVASIPEEEFELAIEDDDEPLTVTTMAERGLVMADLRGCGDLADRRPRVACARFCFR
jgi:hypothetical protein